MTRAVLALAVLSVASPVLAQAPSPAAAPAQLRVVVLDETGAGIPASVVTVAAPGAAPVKVVADDRGVATIPLLPAAAAQLHVEAAAGLHGGSEAARARRQATHQVERVEGTRLR